MISQREIERYLDDWLGTTPMDPADRVVVAVAVRIRRQRQRPFPRFTWDWSRFAAARRIVLAAAAVAVVGLVGLAVLSRLPAPGPALGPSQPPPGVTTAPTTAPTAPPPASPSTPPLVPAVSLKGGLPDGWTVTASGMLTFSAEAAGESMLIELLPNRVVMAATCEDAPEPGSGSSAVAIVEALEARRGVIATGRRYAAVGGLTGVQIELRLDPAGGPTCPRDEPAYVPLFGSADPAGWNFTGISGNERIRLVALDVPGGQNVMIFVSAPSAATFDRFASDATTIIANLEFDTGP